ncbi:aminopeptidase N [Legionella fallonii]|uniref:Aminopeptidase N n=1 Tax=Legionella fallonii LLAP-10 TaxID=1212491 RepID=A0A098G5Z5_9GAMM|nr:aminopeptidase N [Legionella fallonii]CEG56925.1 conserved protein of unknown function [Legionella fallonii LLAP-10]
MTQSKSDVYKLSEYKPLNYYVTHVDLEIDLSKKPIQSTASLTITPNPEADSHSADLILDGEQMTLTSIYLDGKSLPAESYRISDHSLTITNIPTNKSFIIKTTTLIRESTDLFGLYKTEGVYLVKAETEGLRRVFYCNDRPDNLATYRTKIIANKNEYPTLLSNGTVEHREELKNELHSVTWYDEVPKPSYLFALVAGKLQRLVDHYEGPTKKRTIIEFYVSPEAAPKCGFAKEVLQQAMLWDERVCGLECYLERYMIACVDQYASGASETMGLNLFNAENFLATPESKTDLGFLRILEVVAHEFFHYWSGNRVTIRDWFNLPFKEGLTTFRAAMFREDLLGTDLVRLLDGKNLDNRAPRPNSYTAVRSLYTVAAYEKSADIFRMMMLTVGQGVFYKAMTQFFREHDGKAITIEEFIDFLSVATNRNLKSFLFWFTDPGIPEVTVVDEYNPDTKVYTLKFKTKKATGRPIPCVIGLLDHSGKELLTDTALWIDQPEMEFRFNEIQSQPIPSLLRSFSAPVNLSYNYTNESLLLLIKSDPNQYNRVEAASLLIIRLITDYCAGKVIHLTSHLFNTYRSLLTDESLDQWILAELMTLPSEEFLITTIKTPDFKKIAEGRRYIEKALAQELKEDLLKLFNELQLNSETQPSHFSLFNIKEASNRRLKSMYYSYSQHTAPEETVQYLCLQFRETLDKNMTETISALTLLCALNCSEIDELLNEFYQYWQKDSNAMNYWFTVQAAAHVDGIVTKVSQLMQHPAFDLSNPNKVYALLGTFIKNPYGFHNESGEGYALLVDAIINLDKINPTLAANISNSFLNWEQYNDSRQKMMIYSLERIYANATSNDVKNIAKKGLDKKHSLKLINPG